MLTTTIQFYMYAGKITQIKTAVLAVSGALLLIIQTQNIVHIISSRVNHRKYIIISYSCTTATI